jgi:hypothetical protein
VGPFEDVRLELAFNFDQVEPVDIGRCGEPYAANLVCGKAFGLMAHGITGVGLAGELRPPDPWHDLSGLEVGARLEFRAGAFSFQISDFYGYNDFPHVKRLWTYERNVDPETGRPRKAGNHESCKDESDSACLGPGGDALRNHYANQQTFALSCAVAFGAAAVVDPGVCGTSVFNSQTIVLSPGGAGLPPAGQPVARLMIVLSNILAGQATGRNFYVNLVRQQSGGTPLAAAAPLVPLNFDPSDCLPPHCGDPFPTIPNSTGDAGLVDFFLIGGLERFLTDEQEALLGCGPLFRTRCDVDGLDFLNAEASALVQAWPLSDGVDPDHDSSDGRLHQPGTVDFEGGPTCTRFSAGRTWILPGCRGPNDAGYDPDVDGTVVRDGFGIPGADNDLRHPFTGQRFSNEMGAVSWNLLMLLVGFTSPDDPDNVQLDEFDAAHPFRADGCSFAKPALCFSAANFFYTVGNAHYSVRAGGNGRFGRRDFVWHGGGTVAIDYAKRNVLGFAMDFAEDVTKTNWGLEATWVEGALFQDQGRFDGLTSTDVYNLTVSVDRPTFVNFLNANRTFLINSQWFVNYIRGWDDTFTFNGPFNVFFTFTVTTGYLQDRLLPSITSVYDFKSNSGALLSGVTYRLTENFSATLGATFFYGRSQRKAMALNPVAPPVNRVGRNAYRDIVDNTLAAIRDRDEVSLIIRYTF